MLRCFAAPDAPARPAHVVAASQFATWRDAAGARVRGWLAGSGFSPKPGAVALIPGAEQPEALLVVADPGEPWDAAALQEALPPGDWRLVDPANALAADRAVLGW